MKDNVDTEAVGYITARLTDATDGKKEISVDGVYLLCAAESNYVSRQTLVIDGSLLI